MIVGSEFGKLPNYNLAIIFVESMDQLLSSHQNLDQNMTTEEQKSCIRSAAINIALDPNDINEVKNSPRLAFGKRRNGETKSGMAGDQEELIGTVKHITDLAMQDAMDQYDFSTNEIASGYME